MVKCKICGVEKKSSIVEHLKYSHKMSSKEYRELFDNAQVKSDEYKLLVSKQQKEVWSNKDYVEKMCLSRQQSHRKEEFRAAQSKRIKKVYENGFKCWNDGLTKETDTRVASIGLKNSAHLTGRRKEDFDYLLVSSVKRKENPALWEQFVNHRDSWSEEKISEWKQKISKSVCDRISSGKINPLCKGYKQGWHEKPSLDVEFYDSSWEKELMEYLDNIQVSWTKKHGIILNYKDESFVNKRYIPDFLIEKFGKKVLLELKGYVRSQHEVDSKKLSAEVWAKNNSATYLLCFSVEEAKLKIESIYEISKNKTN